MKKTIRKVASVLVALLLLLATTSCAAKQDKEITCEDVIRAYEEAGYEVFHKETPTSDDAWNCYLTVQKAGDESEHPKTVNFHFFDTAEEAEAYAEERRYNVLIWFFSVIYGDPMWITTKAYRNIEIEYEKREDYKPFLELVIE